MLLRWRCCCVQEVDTLKMLLRSRCCYVEDVVHLRMLSKRLCGCGGKKGSCAFRPWFSGGLWHVYVYQKKPEIPKKHANPIGKAKMMVSISCWTWKKNIEHWNSGQHIPDMLSGCWTNSWYCHVIGRTQNTVKHNEKWHVSNWNTMNFNCLPRNRQPLPYIYIYTHSIVYICNVANIWGLILDNQWEACKEWRNKGIVRI